MYVITFYSFKGGVGRTLALANVGMELAQTGRRVLLVDFDLEAPGIDTFEALRPPSPTPGIVDFVTSYRQTGTAPNVADFVYRCQRPSGMGGELLVMPTGLQDEKYGSKLNSIDWQRLYSEQDGFVLFEDLKAQWAEVLRPDYVLVDSRTGHTDVGGICTRQLPDALAILFFPNDQNRRGLAQVVADVRGERRKIETYFIAANVPDLDDEEAILKDRLNEFRTSLEYEEIDGIIHHYDSLSLLKQTVFTLERPRTKLAREYRRLTDRVIAANLADRKVVLNVLSGLASADRRRHADPRRVDEHLTEIRARYARDGEVLDALAQANRALGRNELADRLVLEAEQCGFASAERLLDRAAELYEAGELPVARQTISEALHRPNKRMFTAERAAQLLLKYDTEFLPEFTAQLNTSQVSPSDRLFMAERLMSRRDAAPSAVRLLQPVRAMPSWRDIANAQLTLALIAQGRFIEAQVRIAKDRSSLADAGIQDTFNYAVAEWGATGRIPRDLFSRVVRLAADMSASARTPNFMQCLAVAHWAIGDGQGAREWLARAREAIQSRDEEFSAWRYLKVPAGEFLRDLDEMRAMIAGVDIKPAVLRQ